MIETYSECVPGAAVPADHLKWIRPRPRRKGELLVASAEIQPLNIFTMEPSAATHAGPFSGEAGEGTFPGVSWGKTIVISTSSPGPTASSADMIDVFRLA